MLYDNQISSVLWSPPNQGLTNLATPVLAPHPNKIMTVVNEGWQSSTTVREEEKSAPRYPMYDGQHLDWITSQAESGSHPAQKVPNHPLLVQLVVVQYFES